MGEEAQALVGHDRVLELTSSIRANNASGTFSTLSTISPPAVITRICPPTSRPPVDISARFTHDEVIGSRAKHQRFRRAICVLGLVQIFLGALLLIFNLLMIVSSLIHYHLWVSVGLDVIGIIVGIITGIAGIFGVLVSRRATTCRVIACLVMAIIAAIAAGIEIILNAIMSISGAQYFSRAANRSISTSGPQVQCAVGIVLLLLNVLISIVVASFMCANSACCCNGGGFGGGKTVYVAVPMENLGEVITRNAGAKTNEGGAI